MNVITALQLLLNAITTLLPMGLAEIEQVKSLRTSLQGYADRYMANPSPETDMTEEEMQPFRDFDNAAAARLANAQPGVATPPADL